MAGRTSCLLLLGCLFWSAVHCDDTNNWCGNHGNCHRYGPKKEQYICCCDQEYTGRRCEVEITTRTTTPTTTIIPCIPVNDCTSHYSCGPQGQMVCRWGWTGANCDSFIADGPADCNVFNQDEFIPSEWGGNYTCSDNKELVVFRVNITRSTQSVGTLGNLVVGSSVIAIAGSFASFYKTFTLQGQDVLASEIFTRNFTGVELNGILNTPTFITGKILFAQGSGTYTCDMQLRRQAAYVDWCSSHGTCYRYGSQRDQFSCCCDPGYTGATCSSKVARRSLTTQTYQRLTITTTMQAHAPCLTSVYNCTIHYNCGADRRRICVDGYTGNYCETVIPNGVADCDAFDNEATTLAYEYETIYIHQTAPPSDYEYNCTFTYGLCGWGQAFTDTFDWTLQSGMTGSSGTGPNGDHTTSNGRYLYIETSSPRRPTDYAILEGAYFDIEPWETKCFSFWYNMYGSSIGRLSIFAKQSGQQNYLWTLAGNQGSVWHHAQVNVTGNGRMQLVIEGTVGSSYLGDIAIDDTELTDEACTGQSDSDEYEQTTTNPWWGHQTSDYISARSPIRLVGGLNHHSGRVEVYHNGEWGTICDDDFNHVDARVVCKVLGLYRGYSYGKVYGSAYFGRGSGSIMLDDLGCTGYENSIDQCSSRGWYNSNCDHSEDVGIDCFAEWDTYGVTTDNPLTFKTISNSQGTRIRLEGGNYHSGRVAVYHGGQWGTICDDDFDHEDVMVVCRMLGFNQGDGYGVAYSNAHFGPGSGPILLDNLNCYGYESDISYCSSNGWYNNDCGHKEDVGVDCYAPYYRHEQTTVYPGWLQQSTDSSISVRLVNGPNYHSGTVQVRRHGVWGTVCDDDFDHNDVMVICRMLGLYQGESYGRAYSSSYFGQGSGPIYLDNLRCYGYESELGNCRSNGWGNNDCSHSEDAGVDCYAYSHELTTEYPWWIHQTSSSNDGMVRLVGGNYYSGRVEVYSRGQWGTVCDDSFDHNDVKVICRMLGVGYGESYGVAYSSAYFGQGSGPIIIDDLQCNGYEADIKYCSSNPWYQNNCDHGEDAAVNCHAYYQEMTSPSYTTYPWWLTTRHHRIYSTTFPWWLTTRYHTIYSTTFPWWRTTYNPWWTHYTTHGYRLQDAIVVNCNEYTWDIKVDMNRLRQIYPNAKGSDIYLGENKCTGIERNGHLTFQQGLDECLTSETLQYGVHVYNNELIYAEHDPKYLFIIRHYNWTLGMECDVQRDGSVYGGINNNEASTIGPSVSSQQYPVNISYYLDANFIKAVSGSPLHADVGAHVYVKVFTTTTDWDARMRVHTCYTKPTPNAPDHMKFYLIKNGCEVDTNTHIISQSTHETRFMFDQFEYTSNHEGIYVFCDTVFCHSSDFTTRCRQTCNPVIRRKVAVENIQAKEDENDKKGLI